MKARDSERKRARPPRSSDGIEALLDQWVSELEQDAPRSTREPNRAEGERLEPLAPSPERPEPAPGSPHEPEAAEHPGAEKDHVEAVRTARAEIRVQGPLVTFREGAQVLFTREGGRLCHRGTVAVRGPCAPAREELLRLGVNEAQARALDFVLAWFGAPFDAVSGDSQSGENLRWGAWPLPGPALAQVLALWKQREPRAFQARLGRLGIDLQERAPEPPTLTVLDVRDGHLASGREALTLIADDLRLLAALAQAGRERGAQLALLEWLLEHALFPVLELSGQDSSPPAPPGGPFTSPRALAALLHVELRFGRRGASRLVVLAREEAGDTPGAGERAALRITRDMQATGRGREAAEMRCILSSPELSVAPA
ncbi:hypothetical protein ACN28E_03055 [Archangium lansingense]|uniref:hypothetical protein n=1 Tax=Archangium lansingense TaxID=2995310 RepID=UPI003B82770B